MKKASLFLCAFCFFLGIQRPVRVQAQEQIVPVASEESQLIVPAQNWLSRPALPANNITDGSGESSARLGLLISEQVVDASNPLMLMRLAVHRAIAFGMPANTLAFVLLFPLIAALIAFARHVIGLSGLSMYAPAALAVALLSLGISSGTLLFAAVLFFASVGRRLLSGLKLPYLPRTAMILWVVSFGVFGLLILSTFMQVFLLSVLNVFALLILILLSENFLEISGSSSPMIAFRSVLETFVLGLLCALVLGSELIQSLVLLYPELTFLFIGAINILIGRYLGLRLTEWLRFRQLTDEQE